MEIGYPGDRPSGVQVISFRFEFEPWQQASMIPTYERSRCIQNHFHIFHVIMGQNYVYIFPRVGTRKGSQRHYG